MGWLRCPEWPLPRSNRRQLAQKSQAYSWAICGPQNYCSWNKKKETTTTKFHYRVVNKREAVTAGSTRNRFAIIRISVFTGNSGAAQMSDHCFRCNLFLFMAQIQYLSMSFQRCDTKFIFTVLYAFVTSAQPRGSQLHIWRLSPLIIIKLLCKSSSPI